MNNTYVSTGRKILLSVPLVMTLLFAGCGDNHKAYRIGVSQPSDDEWRSQMNDEIRREILFHDDAEVEIRSADDNSLKQVSDLRYFVNENFDLIIVAPNEAETLTPVVRDIYKSGIPVIVFDRALNDTSYTSYIDLDNVGIGKEAAKYAIGAARKNGGAVVELRGLAGSTPAEERHLGFTSTLDSVPEINFIGTFNADWNAQPSARLTDSLLASNPEIGVIYAQNDVMAIAAAKTARKRGRNDIVVIGTDGAPKLGIQAVEDSVIDVTFTYPTVGDRVIKTAMNILHGNEYEKIQHIPAISFITRDNAGMHLRANEVLAQKTEQLEQMNSLNTLMKGRENSQKWIIYAISLASFLLLAIIVGLLYFLRQKNKYQNVLADKNAQLLEEKEKKEQLFGQLEEATRSKLAFYTNVSHDLRTPLALIADPVEKIEKEKYLPAGDKALMKMVVKNVKILRRMIDQILDFSRYENGVAKLNLREADILALVDEWSSNFIDYSKRHKIVFKINIQETDGAPGNQTMAIDVEKMQRVFFNLLSNAFKYTPANREVCVNARFEDSFFVLQVCDTGTGMSKEEMSKIFDRFYQVDRPRPKGSGIGLSLSKAFVEMMGGNISVESEPGEGSCFTVRIPVSHSDTEYNDSPLTFDSDIIEHVVPEKSTFSESDALAEMEKEKSEKPLMLVIDDNEDIRALVGLMSRDTYNVIEAADGKEGLRLAMKYIPDVIVCDIMMPEIDGLEVTRRLKEERITSHIPVLILTACRLDEQRVRSYDSGADGFLAKPFSELMLKARCAALINNRRKIYDLLLEEGADTSAIFRKEIPEEKNDSRLALDNDFYRDFIRWVRKLYTREDLSIGEIAEKFGIGATQLTRKIKAMTGNTPVEIIREFRLNEARKRLLTTKDTVAEIAYSTGFSSPQYFARCFRDAYNMTPSELRASVK